MPPTANSTYGGQQHFWCVRYRTAAAALELCYVDAEMRSYSILLQQLLTVTAPFYGAALSVIAYFLS